MATTEPQTSTQVDDRLAVDTIRTLAIDAVQKANSGHPGMPMGMAPAAYVLFTRVMRHNPRDPHWPDRDRFVLSAGHASMLLYACLHLSGYDLPLDELKRFRQWGSRTPGHPEVHHTPGVETTTGPLGQGFANGVGMAMAERFLRERFGTEVHRPPHLRDLLRRRPDGGRQRRGRLDRRPPRARPAGLPLRRQPDHDRRQHRAVLRTEDVEARFRAYGWHMRRRGRQRPRRARAAIAAGIAEEERPTLIRVRTMIALRRAEQGRHRRRARRARSARTRCARRRRRSAGIPDEHFHVPDEVCEQLRRGRARRRRSRREWEERFRALARRRTPTLRGGVGRAPGPASRCPGSAPRCRRSSPARTSSRRASPAAR